MAFDAHKNFAYSTVATAPSPASSGTSLVVAAGDGTKFPAASFNATVWPANTQPTTTNSEIVRVTVISTDTFTITRAQESTSARTIVVGDQIAATITAKTLTDVESAAAFVPPMVISWNLNSMADLIVVAAPTNATFTAADTTGVIAKIATTTNSGSFGRWGFALLASNPTIHTAGMIGTAFVYVRCAVASTGDFFLGFGSPGASAASVDYATQNHIGWKFTADGSQLTMAPTVSNGTETAGSAINISNDNHIALKWVYVSSSQVDFYYSINGAAYTKVTLTTHIPTGTESYFGYSISNKNTATQVNYDIRGHSIQF